MNVSDYKKHPLFPFADFRENDAALQLLIDFWQQLVKESLGEELFPKCETLQDYERDNGPEPFYNPVMFDFWLPSLDRGARITLTENFDNSPLLADAKGDERFSAYNPFVFYMSFRRLPDNSKDIPQIVLCSDMCDSSLQSTQKKLREFLVDQISVEKIEEMRKKRIRERSNYPTEGEWDAY
ncbi:hypothetical protein [Thalassospira sp. MCCC 1A01428]|uniref:hypothetical protein n=1 Tax=Thalassospira sp. MCCC 1A01428 TaxID=1470575 RepID=UPI000A1E8B3C|nr:hypothetical protein [Thalassospira sp. MCCC 1A01428]OSQ43940.1 hypothetical protein THS27_09005 [Thalassospira sp. MCCC 1A01428]